MYWYSILFYSSVARTGTGLEGVSSRLHVFGETQIYIYIYTYANIQWVSPGFQKKTGGLSFSQIVKCEEIGTPDSPIVFKLGLQRLACDTILQSNANTIGSYCYYYPYCKQLELACCP